MGPGLFFFGSYAAQSRTLEMYHQVILTVRDATVEAVAPDCCFIATGDGWSIKSLSLAHHVKSSIANAGSRSFHGPEEVGIAYWQRI